MDSCSSVRAIPTTTILNLQLVTYNAVYIICYEINLYFEIYSLKFTVDTTILGQFWRYYIGIFPYCDDNGAPEIMT